MKTICKTLKSKKQLYDLVSKETCAAEFSTDGKCFLIEFEVENGMHKDLLIDFATRTPRVYVSDAYANEIGV